MEIFKNLTELEIQCLQGIRNELMVCHKKAMGGDLAAQYELAMLYLAYCPTPRFEDEAYRLLTLSAEQGHDQSKNQLRVLSVSQDDKEEIFAEENKEASKENDLSAKTTIHAYKKANDKNKRVIIEKLPQKTYEVLKSDIFKGDIPIDKILYAGKIYKRKKFYWLIIPFLILLFLVFNQALLQTIGIGLGPILVGITILALIRGFRYKYYLFILENEAVIIPEGSGESYLRFGPQGVLEIITSFVDGSVKITVDERGLEGNPHNSKPSKTIIIKFKIDSHSSSGGWHNIEYAFLNSHFSDKLVNEAKLRHKFNVSTIESNPVLKKQNLDPISFNSSLTAQDNMKDSSSLTDRNRMNRSEKLVESSAKRRKILVLSAVIIGFLLIFALAYYLYMEHQNKYRNFEFVADWDSEYYHKPDCVLINSIDSRSIEIYRTYEEVAETSLRPCPICIDWELPE